MKTFPLSHVTLLDGPFAAAASTGSSYVLSLDVDRLLAPFLREAGLPHGESYGNWESSGLDGHIGGHLLSALALTVEATGDPEAARRLAYLVDGLARAQRAIGDGYVGGIPNGHALFEALRTGGQDAAARLGSSASWVPWYNLHKTFAGLIDAHRRAGSDIALEVVTALADWWLDLAESLDDATFEMMLDTEFGGMTEAFADLADLTGGAAYADMARRFAHRAILDPLREGALDLTGHHANTEIAKAVGYARLGAVTDDAELTAAADRFWCDVVQRRTVANGGNSVREHFHSPDDFAPMIEDREGPESCNTVNMLKMTAILTDTAFDPAQLDFAERALVNHVLASQHPETGGLVYFTPMRPRHYRVYSQAQESMWCCVGTGLEAHAMHGRMIFGEHDGALAVNLFIPAVLRLPGGGELRLEADLPADDRVTLTFAGDDAVDRPLRVRVPGWSAGLIDLRVNRKPIDGRTVPGAVVIDRVWRPGDTVTFRLPLAVRAERLPDGGDWAAFFAGPFLLAARSDGPPLAGAHADDGRMAHIARGPLLGFGDLPIVADDSGALRRDADGGWSLVTLDPPGRMRLEPLHTIHDARYTVYWPVATASADRIAARRAALVAADEATLAVDALTIDAVALGEQQPESDHGFVGDDALLVVDDDGRRARATVSEMTVTLSDPHAEARLLRVGYRLTGHATAVTVRVGDEIVGDEAWDAGDASFAVDYGLPGEFTAEQAHPSRIPVTFTAAAGAPTPEICSVRLLRWATP